MNDQFDLSPDNNLNHAYSMASSPRVNLNQYLNDLDTYQRKKVKKDPNNRVNVPYYRKVAKLPHSGMNSPGNQIHITKGLTLQERDKKHGPNLVPALKLKSSNRGLYSRLPNCSYPHIDVSTSGDRSGSSVEGGGGILAGGPRRNSNKIISNSMLPSIQNEKYQSGGKRHDHPFSPRNDGLSKH